MCDVDRFCIKRKEGGRALITAEHAVRGDRNSLDHYVLNLEDKVAEMSLCTWKFRT